MNILLKVLIIINNQSQIFIMFIKRSIIKIIACVFTIFLTVKYITIKVFLKIFGEIPSLLIQNLRESNHRLQAKVILNNISQKDGNTSSLQLSDCYQQIIDSSLSLLFTTFIVNYNFLLLKLAVLISYYVHHQFLSILKLQINDYSLILQQKYSPLLVYAFIVCGSLGVSSQICLLLDIIHLMTFPTRLLYKLLAFTYSKLVIKIPLLYEFITKDYQSWISCPYPKWIMSYYFRVAGILSILLAGGFMIVLIGYYAWVVGLVVGLDVFQKIIYNFRIFTLRFGIFVCYFKSWNYYQPNYSFIPIIELSSILKIIKGIDIFKRQKFQARYFTETSQKFSTILLYKSLIKRQFPYAKEGKK